MRPTMLAASSIGPTPKPEWSWLMPPMAMHRRAPEDREPDVVDHLPGVLLEDRDRAHAARGVGDRPRRGTATG